MDGFDRQRLNEAFAALGERLRMPARIVVGGAGALILNNELSRATVDCDVLLSHPEMGLLLAPIREVADQLGLVGGWLNGSAQSYAEITPPDYMSRLHSMPPFGRLQVMVLHRRDVLVMKLYAGRPRDLADIAELAPTDAELVFAAGEIPRIQKIDKARAQRMLSLVAGLARAAR